MRFPILLTSALLVVAVSCPVSAQQTISLPAATIVIDEQSPVVPTGTTAKVTVPESAPKTCAIPLLAVTPKKDSTDKMVVTPKGNPDPKMTIASGAPPCGVATSSVPATVPLIIETAPVPLIKPVPLKK